MRANQVRLWFASAGCVLLCALVRIAVASACPSRRAFAAVTAFRPAAIAPSAQTR